ncbi:MAG TPA: hypothetical protein VM432_05650 [Bdellovibrionales bacterium]|nr:hypothetical protein [Bdellovibrionales bacterium]
MKTVATILPLLLALGLTGCGAIKATEEMGGKVDQTNSQVTKTNEAVRKQKMMISLEEILSDENSLVLEPVPLGMFAYGKTFAEAATAQEIVDLAYLYFKEIDSIRPPDSERDPVTGEWKPETVAKFDHDKLKKFYAIMVISGFAPQSTINQMVGDQIFDGGRHEETAYKVLMLRYTFISAILLGESLFPTGLTNVGKMQYAVDYANYLSFIEGLSFGQKIAVKTNGMLNPDNNKELSLSMFNTQDVWERIALGFETELEAKYTSKGSKHLPTLQVLRAKINRKVGSKHQIRKL